MTQNPTVIRSLAIYGIVLPLALFLGYMLATPQDRTSFFTVGFVLLLLMLPLLLKWHHPLLVVFWNTTAVVFFLPGRPAVWLGLAFVSCMITLFQRALNRKMRVAPAPSVLWPLLFIGAVMLMTAHLTGGIGLGSLRSEVQGGKRYFMMLAAIMGFIAISSHPIARNRVVLFIALFFLSSLTALIGSAFYYVSSSFHFLFWIFPVDATTIGLSEYVPGDFVGRSWGLTLACSGVVFFLLARYGIRQMLERRWWALLLLAAVALFGAFGGFRSYLILVGVTFLTVFMFEGLHRSKHLGVFVLLGLLVASVVVAIPDRLPLSIQRTISFLPLDVSPIARMSADASSEWRVQIWRSLLPEVRENFWLGKGLGIKGREFNATVDASQRTGNSAEVATLAADYHNGPLSVVIPFGIWGLIGWIWFLAAGARTLYLNYAYGAPELKTINRFMLGYFITRIVMFFAVFGSFYSDLAIFAGIVALSVSINHGVARKPAPAVVPEAVPASPPLAFRPRALARAGR